MGDEWDLWPSFVPAQPSNARSPWQKAHKYRKPTNIGQRTKRVTKARKARKARKK